MAANNKKSDKQRGSALPVGLVILLVLTILGVAGMKGARINLLQAGNKQFLSQTFEAASAGVQVQLESLDAFSPQWVTPSNPVAISQQGAEATSTTVYMGSGPVPPALKEFSVGGSFTAQMYEIHSVATHAESGAYVAIRQGAYKVSPGE